MRPKIIPLFLLLLLVQCSETQKIIDWEKKEAEWREGVGINDSFYQVAVEVPKGEVKSENIKKAESLAKLKLADLVQVDIEHSELWKKIGLDKRKIEAANRSSKKLLAAEIETMELESSLTSNHTYFAAYKINKIAFKKLYEEKKNTAIKLAKLKWQEGMRLVEKKEPQQAANLFCEALIIIENYLGNDLTLRSEIDSPAIDQEIINGMKALRNAMSIKLEPRDTVLLNHDNDFIGILNFEVLQNKIKTGKINLSIDVASIRQDKLTVNAYSVLINDLPVRLRNPYVKIRSDLFQDLRLDGNELSQLIYQQVPSISSQVIIDRAFQNVCVVEGEEGLWQDEAVQMLTASLKNSNVNLMDNNIENVVKLKPTILLTSDETNGFCKLTAQWQINVQNTESQIKGVRLLATSSSIQKAQADILNRLQEQMNKVIVDDLLKLLIDSKSR